ncbi:MAG: aconitate hydratase [Planctomycetota bacterium]|jgi:aconitate hydratase
MVEIPTAAIRSLYERFDASNGRFRRRLKRPLTYAEKILFLHLDDPDVQALERGRSSGLFRVDRVAMQDATAQMALLQFMQTGRAQVAVPSTVHCDHLIRAQTGATVDLERAQTEHGEVYRFLADCAAKYGIGFWKPGAGIIHQVVLENYAFPGGMMIGTDSHTPNAGGLGMIAIGVGGADAAEAMAGMAWGVRMPTLLGVHLKGTLSGWTSAKDVILKVADLLTVKGGTGAIVEYFGPGTRGISTTGKATITNMGAEIGATTSLFPCDARMPRYLRATGRVELAELVEEYADRLTADPEVEADPERFFDRIIEIDLDELEPHLVGPHTPDLAHPVSRMKKDVAEQGYPDEISSALIGSCTNSSYEDMGRAAHVAHQARKAGLRVKTPLLVTPGSESVHRTIQRDGQMEILTAAGALVLANACGPCIGQWTRDDIEPGTPNSILTSYNRNFRRRNDGSAETMAFIGSPEIVTAMAFAGRLSFDPRRDSLPKPGGGEFRFEPPEADDLPAQGLVDSPVGYVAPAADGSKVETRVDPQSERLQLLAPFAAWDGRDFEDLPVLLKVKGKCTTDHISPAGPWLRYRGHLDRISDNMFIGAINAFTGEEGRSHGRAFHEVAREHKAAGRRWVVFGDDNYGEGSSREHAAMSPRFLGAAAVVTKSFARIHETNLKKQGVLPLTLADPADFDKVSEDDRVSVTGLTALAPGSEVVLVLKHADGGEDRLACRHTLTDQQIEWFRAGSALAWIGSRGV